MTPAVEELGAETPLARAQRVFFLQPEVAGPVELRGLLALGSSHLVYGVLEQLHHMEAVEGSKVTWASGRCSPMPLR